MRSFTIPPDDCQSCRRPNGRAIVLHLTSMPASIAFPFLPTRRRRTRRPCSRRSSTRIRWYCGIALVIVLVLHNGKRCRTCLTSRVDRARFGGTVPRLVRGSRSFLVLTLARPWDLIWPDGTRPCSTYNFQQSSRNGKLAGAGSYKFLRQRYCVCHLTENFDPHSPCGCNGSCR